MQVEAEVEVEVALTVEASVEELLAIDAAVRGYIQLLRFVVDPSHDRDEVIAQLRSFQRKYDPPLMAWRAQQRPRLWSDAPVESGSLISWQATIFELLAFSSAVVGYLHLLESTHASSEVRHRMICHLLEFERRYMERHAASLPERDSG